MLVLGGDEVKDFIRCVRLAAANAAGSSVPTTTDGVPDKSWLAGCCLERSGNGESSPAGRLES